MDLKDVQPYIEEKICMVTGGGGSIGSEIVRSLSKLNAEKIGGAIIILMGILLLLGQLNSLSSIFS